MAPEDHPSEADEIARYRTHEAGAGDPGHRAFLRRLVDPVVAALEAAVGTEGLGTLEGLDFGSGPRPVLSELFQAHGVRMRHWDPLYAPDPAPLAARYDLVVLTEVVEHLKDVKGTLDFLEARVRPGGWLALMTDPERGVVSLDRWYYLRDPTHVSLFRPETLEWVAHARGWTHRWLEPRVILYALPTESTRAPTRAPYRTPSDGG
jgi:hypothetical protein